MVQSFYRLSCLLFDGSSQFVKWDAESPQPFLSTQCKEVGLRREQEVAIFDLLLSQACCLESVSRGGIIQMFVR